LTQAVKSYLLGIVAVSLAVSMAAALLRDGVIRKSVLITGGLVIVLAVIGPVLKLDYGSFGQFLTKIEIARSNYATGIEVQDKELIARIIQDKTEAYILDKAAELGAEVTAEVTAVQGEFYPYPYSVEITGVLSPKQLEMLKQIIAQTLGIPAERQEYTP